MLYQFFRTSKEIRIIIMLNVYQLQVTKSIYIKYRDVLSLFV